MIDLLDKFYGVLVGTMTGDALGMPVEGSSPYFIQKRYGEIREMLEARLGAVTYTDDTEMTIALAESLVRCKNFDGEDMANSFIENFNSARGYGSGTIKALELMRQGEKWNEAGRKIFNGGSYGNGSAMRVSPVGCLYHHDLEVVKKVAEESSKITHTHTLGKEGAALQACGVALAVSSDPQEKLDVQKFLESLLHLFEKESPFYKKLHVIGDFLNREVSVEEVINSLGNDSSAPNSVPTAIYSFLRNNNDFEDALVFAVGLGGDTDTIGAMTGALAGGYLGKSSMPGRWLNTLEEGEKGINYIETLSRKLCNLHKEIASLR